MPSPFPGMDPYLEHPALWPDVHHRLLSVIAEEILPLTSTDYYTLVEERVYVGGSDDPRPKSFIPDVIVHRTTGWAPHGGIETQTTALLETEPVIGITVPDAEISEAYLTIRDRATHEVVTVIEVLSPGNKSPGTNSHASYVAKRDVVLSSPTNLVEIDLLRGGERFWPLNEYQPADYLVHVSAAKQRPKGQVWKIVLPQKLPKVQIPLKPPDPPVPLDLSAVFATIYQRAGYDRVVDYSQECQPPLSEPQRAWANDVMKQAGLLS